MSAWLGPAVLNQRDMVCLERCGLGDAISVVQIGGTGGWGRGTNAKNVSGVVIVPATAFTRHHDSVVDLCDRFSCHNFSYFFQRK